MASDVRGKLLKQWMLESEDDLLGYTPCEIQWDRWCRGRAQEGHEPLTRARGGSITDRKNVLLTCRHCHDSVHAYPVEAERRGFLVPASEGARGVTC